MTHFVLGKMSLFLKPEENYNDETKSSSVEQYVPSDHMRLTIKFPAA